MFVLVVVLAFTAAGVPPQGASGPVTVHQSCEVAPVGNHTAAMSMQGQREPVKLTPHGEAQVALA